MAIYGIVAEALKEFGENPEEFIAPGIGKARENYQNLRELYDGLSERLELHGVNFPGSMHDVRRELRSMENNLMEAADGYSLRYELYDPANIDRIICYLAFVEKYFGP